MDFLYYGANPPQTGVAAGVMVDERLAVLRGRVLDPSGAAVAAVTVGILDHAELGETASRADGGFDFAVNGGGRLVVAYTKAGYLDVHRPADVPRHSFIRLDDVVLTPLAAVSTAVDTAGPDPIAVVRGEVGTDADGSRQATVFIAAGTVATIHLPGGGTQDLTSFHVRVTEYTVGDRGPEAMPAPLGPTVAYTYAVELALGEAEAVAAESVTFDQTVIGYVETFLGYPVGESVPIGFYDRTRGVWVPEENGRTLKILGVLADLAELDVDGGGSAADAAALAMLGISDEERHRLAALYPVGQELWRMPVAHFAPCDPNRTLLRPSGAEAPDLDPGRKPGTRPGKPCKSSGSSVIARPDELAAELRGRAQARPQRLQVEAGAGDARNRALEEPEAETRRHLEERAARLADDLGGEFQSYRLRRYRAFLPVAAHPPQRHARSGCNRRADHPRTRPPLDLHRLTSDELYSRRLTGRRVSGSARR
ncbi:MAG: carboxypeptidase regulatory-like domain-containing protein [Candidatus Schekmanbacteria bacterium]|nr:carboxypeptidase regulatory-like domain-containing protein [Candidatus Schekmanbacteria bacterium]